MGLNKDPAKTASLWGVASFNSKLYRAWGETNGTAEQIRVTVYNGDDAAPSWALVDGGGTNGINRNSAFGADQPSLIVVNSQLYIAWQEHNGTANQLRVAVYNGDDSAPNWTFVDGGGVNGINHDPSLAAESPILGTLGGRLYVVWKEWNASNVYQLRFSVYNGNDNSPSWTSVDGAGANGLNFNTAKDVNYPTLVTFNSSLYIFWTENNNLGKAQLRVRVYNDNDSAPSWRFVDGGGNTGINYTPTKNAYMPSPSVVNDKLYISWVEYLSGVVNYTTRAAVFNGNNNSPAWSAVSGTNGLYSIASADAWASHRTQLVICFMPQQLRLFQN
jgi:hypothetical protein